MAPTVDGQVELRGLLMGRDTPYPLRLFSPWGHPATRTNDVPRPQDHGAFGGPEYYEPRRIPATVLVAADDQAGVEELLAPLAAAWQAPPDDPPDQLEELTWQLGGQQYMARGRPRGAIVDMAGYGTGIVEVGCRFEALDPVVYDATWQAGATVPSSPGGGHGFDVGFPHDFGTPGTPGLITAANRGDWPSRPLARIIAGPAGLDNPRVTHLETGALLDLALHLAPGSYLDLDWQARTILLNGTASRASALRRPASSWFELGPGVSTVRFDVGAGTGSLWMMWRSAWMR